MAKLDSSLAARCEAPAIRPPSCRILANRGQIWLRNASIALALAALQACTSISQPCHCASLTSAEHCATILAQQHADSWRNARSQIVTALQDEESIYLVELGNGDLYLRLGTNGLFASGSSALASGMTAPLTRIAGTIAAWPQVHVAVIGHADNRGRPESNLRLSTKRAEAVARHLAEHGVAARQISAAGKGQSEPVASNDTESGRAANRRIELLLKPG